MADEKKSEPTPRPEPKEANKPAALSPPPNPKADIQPRNLQESKEDKNKK